MILPIVGNGENHQRFPETLYASQGITAREGLRDFGDLDNLRAKRRFSSEADAQGGRSDDG